MISNGIPEDNQEPLQSLFRRQQHAALICKCWDCSKAQLVFIHKKDFRIDWDLELKKLVQENLSG